MATTTATNIAKGLKTYFADAKYDELAYGQKARQFITRVKKVPFVGEDYKVPVYASGGGGVTSTFADAQTMASAPVLGRFNVGANLSPMHKVFQVSSEALARAEKDGAGMLKSVVMKSESILEAMYDNLERMILGGGAYQSIGSVKNTSYATTVLQLNTNSDARWFKTGMVVVVSATDGAALRTGTLTVAKDGNPSTGYVTMSANLSTGISAIQTNDYIYIKGADVNNATQIKSLAAWASTPTTGEDFLGQDRFVAPAQLAFQATTGDDAAIVTAVLDADAAGFNVAGGVRDTCYMNALDFAKLSAQRGTLAQIKEGTRSVAGYSYLGVVGQTGQVIECVASPFVPQNTLYVCDMSSFELVHLRAKPVMIDDLDGSMGMKLASDSGSEYRGYGAAQLGCKAPGRNVKVTLS